MHKSNEAEARVGPVTAEGIRGNLAGFLSTLPAGLSALFIKYDERLRSQSQRRPPAWDGAETDPYWKHLPEWIIERESGASSRLPANFVETIIWGQTALFYAIRIQDDLLDGQLQHSSLRLAPPLFLSEAERAFSSVMASDDDFWRHFRRATHATIGGIVRVWELQHERESPPDELLQAYASVDAIFSVGSAAIYGKLGLMASVPPISQFVGELGKVLLALDDADDIEEDLNDGRFNYVAKMLLGRSEPRAASPEYLAETCRRRAKEGGCSEIKAQLELCLERASEAVAPLELQPAIELIEETRIAVQAL